MKNAKEEEVPRQKKLHQKRSTPPLDYEPSIKRNGLESKFLSDKSWVDEKILISDIQAGDVFKITIQGFVSTHKFGFVEKKDFTSRWRETRCEPGPRGAECHSAPFAAPCTIERREYLGKEVATIDFGNEEEKEKLRFKIGERLYPLGETRRLPDKKSLVTKLEILPEMIEDGDKLFLIKLPKESTESIKTGFFSYGDCPSRNRPGFTHDGPKESRIYEANDVRHYIINAEVEYER